MRTVVAVSGLEVGTYKFYVRSVNMLGVAGDPAFFDTEVVASSVMPQAPTVTAAAAVVGSKDYTVQWSCSHPVGKTATKVWYKIGEEPFISDKEIAETPTSYTPTQEELKCLVKEGAETEITLYVMAQYNVDDVPSLVGSSTVTVDLKAPAAPKIAATVEIFVSLQLNWSLSPADNDTAQFEYQAGVDEAEPNESGWTTVQAAAVTYQDTPVADQTITLYARAIDALGNRSPLAAFTTTVTGN